MLYLVLEVAIDEVGLANDRDRRGEGQEQQGKGEHLVGQTTWSPRQRMTPGVLWAIGRRMTSLFLETVMGGLACCGLW